MNPPGDPLQPTAMESPVPAVLPLKSIQYYYGTYYVQSRLRGGDFSKPLLSLSPPAWPLRQPTRAIALADDDGSPAGGSHPTLLRLRTDRAATHASPGAQGEATKRTVCPPSECPPHARRRGLKRGGKHKTTNTGGASFGSYPTRPPTLFASPSPSPSSSPPGGGG